MGLSAGSVGEGVGVHPVRGTARLPGVSVTGLGLSGECGWFGVGGTMSMKVLVVASAEPDVACLLSVMCRCEPSSKVGKTVPMGVAGAGRGGGADLLRCSTQRMCWTAEKGMSDSIARRCA